MLINLYLKNFALFDEINIDFEEGLNIISGETGSGKSILLRAMSLVLGGRVNKSIIGNFAKETIVEATFSPIKGQKELLDRFGLSEDDNIIITRRVGPSSSIIKVNNRSFNISSLEDLSQSLMDIHGQHSQLIVLNKSNYLKIIDAFDEETIKIKEQLRLNLKQKLVYQTELADIELNPEEALREADILQFQIDEIEAFNFDSFNQEELDVEYKKLANMTEIIKGINQIRVIFSEGYQRSSLKDYINEIYQILVDLDQYDLQIKEFEERTVDVIEAINDLSRDIDQYSYSIDLDEERLKEIEDLFVQFQNLKRKYGADIEEIKSFHKKSRERLERINNIESVRDDLNKKIYDIEKDNLKLAMELHNLRKKIIISLQEKILLELKEMNMKNISFIIDLQRADQISDQGFDKIDFLISTNKGQDMKSLASVASGGEISRFMLALKAVLADYEDVQTLVFDEIDTGISGMTADVVGDKLVKIAKKRQLIVITHLPQIASKSDSHYLIVKMVNDKNTLSKISKLGDQEKVLEVARLISGSTITDSTIKSAEELISNAKK